MHHFPVDFRKSFEGQASCEQTLVRLFFSNKLEKAIVVDFRQFIPGELIDRVRIFADDILGNLVDVTSYEEARRYPGIHKRLDELTGTVSLQVYNQHGGWLFLAVLTSHRVTGQLDRFSQLRRIKLAATQLELDVPQQIVEAELAQQLITNVLTIIGACHTDKTNKAHFEMLDKGCNDREALLLPRWLGREDIG